MIPRIPSMFQIEEGVVASAVPMPASGELVVGLRLIIQPSPRQQRLPAVLRRSAVRAPETSASSSNSNCHENGRTFVGLEFLKCCFCCHKKLGADMDVFVYKGEHAFCSAECRSRHIAKEERREMEILVRKRRDAFHSRHAGPSKTDGSNRRHLRLQIVA
ncbi:hypothetical protein PR202_ga26833 [Eleusine coracana subsp. coracana]|uniref:FLZ-type domain-containing protein n=1 Tax=Eleusine coracana subsp. coracana TaxID=191504 RepID=A0AAV5DF85_ELECO|nr:hypothetical protein QOZ80_3AG0236220 [Eleusine coracana subsp. coracana]GJN08873.1 hypothetical protein PR202_ga26833 [Eleusine coracana subsp. coracana]